MGVGVGVTNEVLITTGSADLVSLLENTPAIAKMMMIKDTKITDPKSKVVPLSPKIINAMIYYYYLM